MQFVHALHKLAHFDHVYFEQRQNSLGILFTFVSQVSLPKQTHLWLLPVLLSKPAVKASPLLQGESTHLGTLIRNLTETMFIVQKCHKSKHAKENCKITNLNSVHVIVLLVLLLEHCRNGEVGGSGVRSGWRWWWSLCEIS